LKKLAQLAQLPGSSHRPWMKTTGVSPEALAASISRFSRTEIDTMTNSPFARVKVDDPVDVPAGGFPSAT
jgi:hypothetical protein